MLGAGGFILPVSKIQYFKFSKQLSESFCQGVE